MAELEREPELDWAEFVDGKGFDGKIIENIPIKKEGKDFIRMWLLPTAGTVDHYRLKEKDATGPYGSFKKEYPKDYVIWLNKSSSYSKVLLLCDFDGDETELMNQYKDFLIRLDEKDKIIKTLKGSVARIMHQMDKLKYQIKDVED